MPGSLLDAISGAVPGSVLPAAAGTPTDQTEAAKRLLAARTGLADAMSGGGGTPRGSNLAEQSAAATGGQQIREAAAQAAPEQTALADKANEQTAANASARADNTQRLSLLRQQAATRRAQLVQQFKASNAAMDDRSRQAAAEALAQDARLASQRYVDTLEHAGTVERLDNDARFRFAAQQTAIGNQKDLLDRLVANQDWLSASEAEKKKALANMDLDTALAVAARAAEATNTVGVYTAAGQTVSGGLQGYKAYQDDAKQKNTQASPPT